MTREAFENAIAVGRRPRGGSTNGVLHLLAIARELGIPLELDDFDAIAARTPVVASSSRAAASSPPTCTRQAASRSSRASCSKRGAAHADAPNVDGRSLGEVGGRREETPGQEVVVPLETPLKATGGLAILRGTLAPEGAS